MGFPEPGAASPDTGLTQLVRIFDSEGLTASGYDGRAVPRLAESWTAGDDGRAWRLVLRRDVTFHDGTKFTAEAARESLLKALARAGTRALYPGLIDVVDIMASGDYILDIRLKRRSAFLLEDLDLPITRSSSTKQIVGTGAFKATAIDKDEVVLEPHSEYHLGRPKIDKVVIRPYPTLRTAWASLMRQEVDVLLDVAHESAEFVGASDVAFYSYLRRYMYLIAFNSARPKLARAPVRRALNAAIDRASLIENVLSGHGLPASGPLWPHHWAYDSTLRGYGYDPSLAATILDAAGLKLPARRSLGLPSRLSFVCLVPQNYAVLERLALSIQKQLYDIGVDMQLESVTAEEYIRRIPRSDFDAVIIDMISGQQFTRPYAFWRWGGESTGYNVFGYRSAEADRWFDALRFAANDAEYRAAAGQLQRVLLEDPPALFLAWNERTRVVSRRYEVPDDPGRDPIQSLWRWQLRSKATAGTH